MERDILDTPSPLSICNIFSLLAVCVLFLWRPLNVWYFAIDGAARIPFSILLIAFILNIHEIKQSALVPATKLYGAIALYMLANAFFFDSAETYIKGGNWIIFVSMIEPVAVMLLVLNCATKDFNKTTFILSLGLFFYCIMAIINSVVNDRGRLDSEINANEMALYGAITVGTFLICSISGGIRKAALIILIVPVVMIIQTGSRMGFAMIAIMFVTYIIANNDFSSPATITKALLMLVIAYLLFMYVLQNTILGERMLSTTDQSEEFVSTGTILDYYGDRGFQYYYSWPFFKRHPLFGIGFHRWMLFSPTGHVCHSELMVQYVECGLVAFIPWCIFWYLIIKPLNYARKVFNGDKKKVIIMTLSILITMLYADTVLWSYNQFCVFIMYALAIAYPRTLAE